MLAAAQAGKSALLVADTGAGKTLAGFLPSLVELAERGARSGGIHTLYVSPLKALAVDVARNLLAPISEMGLDIRVETRTGDTSPDRKVRQRTDPPDILLTTPESLSLLISYPDAPMMFAGLKRIIVDEVHAFAPTKRGDLLNLAMARLQALSPAMQRIALSATLADPAAYTHWLAPIGASGDVTIVQGEAGADPDIRILLPDGRIPWSGHSGRYAIAQVMAEVAKHRTTIIFCNTRGLAELIFRDLWAANSDNLPIGIHHGSLAREAREKVEGAMAAGQLRALVATASLDLGVDWGDVDCVIQMGAAKGASRLMQRVGRANHRLDQASKAIIVPGNRFEYLEAEAARDAIEEGERDPDYFRAGALDVLAQHIMACACAAPFDAAALHAEICTSAPYAHLDAAEFDRVLGLVRDGGYALRAYDRYRRITQEKDGKWRITHPRIAKAHRLNAGTIVDAPTVDVRFKNGRKLGTIEEYFAGTLGVGDRFSFAGLSLEVERIQSSEMTVRATSKSAQIPSYVGARLPLTTHLADRVRTFLHDRSSWPRFPADVHEWLALQAEKSRLPAPGELLVETFPHEGRHYMVLYPFEGWNAHQALGMLLTRRMEVAGLEPMGFVASDYALAIWGRRPVADPAALFSATILHDEFRRWVEDSTMLKRTFREVAVISGIVERQQPGQRKTGKQVAFSTDLILDVLLKYDPNHVLLDAAWAEARNKMADIGRLGDLIDRMSAAMSHVHLPRLSPMAITLMVLIGRESIMSADTENSMLEQADMLEILAAS